MSVRKSLLRYIHILNKLRKAPASFKEIDTYLKQQSELQGEKYSVSKRHFRRTLDDIESIFEIEITYDSSRDIYFINEQSRSDISQRRMEAFDTFNVLKMGDSVSEYIHFEKRRPTGTEHFFGVLHAIRNQQQLRFDYQKFWDEVGSSRIVDPYALKEFKNRWYVLAKDHKDERIKTFGLDRLSNLDLITKRFEMPEGFSVEQFFQHCFGIISPDDEALKEIILSFDQHQGKYIKSMPLHESQEILIDTEQELRIKLHLFVTYDLVLEILSHGDRVKVISPEELVDQIKGTYQKTLEQYED